MSGEKTGQQCDDVTRPFTYMTHLAIVFFFVPVILFPIVIARNVSRGVKEFYAVKRTPLEATNAACLVAKHHLKQLHD